MLEEFTFGLAIGSATGSITELRYAASVAYRVQDLFWRGTAMSRIGRVVSLYLRLAERSYFAGVVVYGVTAFVVIMGIDLLGHAAGWNWFGERLVCDLLEAAILGLIAAHLARLRGERMFRRRREIRYLNHHIRNSLALIQMAELQLGDVEQRADAVRRATRRISSVLEQLSRDESLNIDEQVPEKYERHDKAE